MIRWALILDTETTGTEDHDACVEVACTLFNLEEAFPLASYAALVDPAKDGVRPANGASAVTGITDAMLRYAESPSVVWDPVFQLAARSDVLVAHNADFDRRFVPDFGKPWVCTVQDIEWPGRRDSRSLATLALSLGVGVVSAHRAMADVDTLTRCLLRVAETQPLVPMFERAMRPKSRFVVRPLAGSVLSNDAFKSVGFRWDDDRREWWRKMPLEDIYKLPFEVEPCEVAECRRFVAMLPYEQRQMCKDMGFQWDSDRKEWWRSMQPNVAVALPFRVVERA